MRRVLIWAPLGLFVLVFALVASGLFAPADRAVKSAMVGKPMPAFSLPSLVPGKPAVANTGFADGKVRLVNVFASWCVPCIAEAPLLMELKRQGVVIDAVAVRDRPEDVAAFLVRHGDPFERIGSDLDSKVQLALGSYGVPESFIVDGRGIIRYQHMGPIEPDDVPELLRQWEAAK